MRVYRFNEVIVSPRVDHFEGGGSFPVQAENQDECIDLAALQPAEEFDTFADSAGRHGHRQQQNIEFASLEELVGRLVAFPFENLEVGTQDGGKLGAQRRVVVDDTDSWLR